MKDLLICRIRRAPNHALARRQPSQILDMGQDNIRWFSVEFGVLPTSLWGDVGGDAGVDCNIVLAGVGFHAETANDEEAMS